MVGPRRRPRRPARLRRPQRPRHRAAAARARRARLRGPARARVEHGRLRRGPLRLPAARRRRAGATRARPTSTPGRFEPTCPRCGRALAPRTVPEDAPLRPAQRLRGDEARAGAPVRARSARETGVPVTALRYHNVYGPRMPRDTPYAGVASIFRSAYAAGRAAARVRGRRPAARLRPRPRRRARERARAHARRSRGPGAFNVASGTPRTVLDMAHALAARLRRAARARAARSPASGARATCATSSRRPSAAAERLGFRAEEDFEAGMAEFAAAPLRT